MCYDTACIEAACPVCPHCPHVSLCFPKRPPRVASPSPAQGAVTTCNPAQCLSSQPEMRSPAPLLLLVLGILTEIILGATADCSNKVPRHGLWRHVARDRVLQASVPCPGGGGACLAAEHVCDGVPTCARGGDEDPGFCSDWRCAPGREKCPDGGQSSVKGVIYYCTLGQGCSVCTRGHCVGRLPGDTTAAGAGEGRVTGAGPTLRTPASGGG